MDTSVLFKEKEERERGRKKKSKQSKNQNKKNWLKNWVQYFSAIKFDE